MLSGTDLIRERRKRGWTQAQAAALLGVSQPYLSLLEAGRRPLTAPLFKRLGRVYVLGPLSMPLLEKVDTSPALLAADLVGLGCPGFNHALPRRWLNPAQVLLLALCLLRLQPEIARALPWVAVEYSNLSWPWLVDRAKLVDCQNRLGFVVTLARKFAALRGATDVAWRLGQTERIIERSRLAREDAFGLGNLTDKRLTWLRAHRSGDARRWNLLTELRLSDLERYLVPDHR